MILINGNAIYPTIRYNDALSQRWILVKIIDWIIPTKASVQTMLKSLVPLSFGSASKHIGVKDPAIMIKIPQWSSLRSVSLVFILQFNRW